MSRKEPKESISINNLIEQEINQAKVPENIRSAAKEIFTFELENWGRGGVRYSDDYVKIIRKNIKKGGT
jgi:uncharacterized protein (UPF0147 family)